MKKFKINFIIYFFLVSLLIGCKNKVTNPEFEFSKERLMVSLSLKPAFQLGYKFSRINAKIQKGLFIDSLDLTLSADSAFGEFKNLVPGTYMITIKAYNEQNYVVAEGSGSAEVIPGKTTVVYITISFINGNLTIIVNWNFILPEDGLISHYPFENNLNDVKGNNNGVLFGNAAFEIGIKGKAIRFFGVDNPSNILVTNSNSLNFLNNFTFTFWLNIQSYRVMSHWGGISDNGFDGGHCILSKSCDINGFTVSVGRNATDSLLVLSVENGKTNNIHRWLTSDKFRLNQWVFFSIVVTTDRIKLYQNGILVSDTTLTWFNLNPQTALNDLFIGKNSCGFYPLNGILDELRIYNRPLSEREIFSLYIMKS